MVAAFSLGLRDLPAGAAGMHPGRSPGFRPGKRKPPQEVLRGFWCKALAMTYSRMRMHTTIGAAAFHFRVRNGIGWFHSAMVTRERVEGRGPVCWPVAHTLSLVSHRQATRGCLSLADKGT